MCACVHGWQIYASTLFSVCPRSNTAVVSYRVPIRGFNTLHVCGLCCCERKKKRENESQSRAKIARLPACITRDSDREKRDASSRIMRSEESEPDRADSRGRDARDEESASS